MRYGGVRGAAGAGRRRGGQRPATVRYRARGSGPGCPATCGENPYHHLAATALPPLIHALRACPRLLRESRPGTDGLARRRCALDDREENPHSIGMAARYGGRRIAPAQALLRLLGAVESRPDSAGSVVAVDPHSSATARTMSNPWCRVGSIIPW